MIACAWDRARHEEQEEHDNINGRFLSCMVFGVWI